MTGNRFAESPPPPTTNRWSWLVIGLVVIGLFAGGLWFGRKWLNQQPMSLPPIVAEQCLAMAGDGEVSLDLEQAKNAAIIVGTSVKMHLPARAASIALATAWQESGLRNIDYGDRDSLGLFQQRPSQGWGSPEQIKDPIYASEAFYRALVKIPNWQSGDINDIAQKVQISAFPDAYRKWVDKAKIVASSLSGHTTGGFSCLVRSHVKVDAGELVATVKRVYGDTVIASVTDGKVTISSNSPQIVWSAASMAIANAEIFGLRKVTIGTKYWELSPKAVVVWKGADDPNAKSASLEFAAV